MNKDEMPKFNIPSFVQEILARLFDAGETAYIVGGSVRDMLLGNEPHDFDITTSALPCRVLEIFSDKRVIKTGIAHGTVTVLSNGFPVEITTFRVDGDYVDMRRPESVSFTRRIEDDLSRRDFTVNAMAYNERDGLVDLFCGVEDIKKKIIRTVGDPYCRFSEDALRILRAFRFSSRLGFCIEDNTFEAISKLCDKLSYIAKERIFSELSGIIVSDGVQSALDSMIASGVMSYTLNSYSPSASATALVSSLRADLILRFAAFFSECDGDVARKELSFLKSSTKFKNSVANIVDASKFCYFTRIDVAHLKSKVGDDAKRVLELSCALGNSSFDVLDLLDDKTPFEISQLAIGGRELSSLGFVGKELGCELNRLLSIVMAEPHLNDASALLEIAKKDKIQGEK